MAHRGASNAAPENSLAAFRLAVDQGADILETDLWFSADHEIICHHDETLQRMTGSWARVSDLNARDLSRLELRGSQPNHPPGVPSLEHLLRIAEPPVVLMLELKDPRFAEPAGAKRLIDILGERVQQHTAGVLSSSMTILRAMRQAAPDLVTGHISMTNPFGSSEVELLGPYWPLLYLNPRYVSGAHRRGQLVCPLDPNLHRRIGKYMKLDVDALLTDDPAATRQLVESLRQP